MERHDADHGLEAEDRQVIQSDPTPVQPESTSDERSSRPTRPSAADRQRPRRRPSVRDSVQERYRASVRKRERTERPTADRTPRRDQTTRANDPSERASRFDRALNSLPFHGRQNNASATIGHPALPAGTRDGHSPSASSGKKARKPRKQNFITRRVNHWCNRLLGAVSDRSLADQEEEYASHRTTRDFVWNAIGTGTWGLVFPLLTIVATQLAGTEQAGMFSIAFSAALVLMVVGNYGARNFQASDLDEEHSFSDYQVSRVLTCVVMMLVAVGYCTVRGYDSQMFTICMGVCFYKMVDALADVYEGRLQQLDKLYLAGVSQAFRSVVAVIAFSVALVLTRDIATACVVMGVASLVTFVLLTYPLALFETPKSSRVRLDSVIELLKDCFPLFVALFLYNLIDNMPKFVMEGSLSYDNQLYYNAMYFPAHALLLASQLIYRPLLVRMAAVWADPDKRMRFDLIIVVILLVVVALTLGMMALMGTVGIQILGFLYGVDFEQFRGLVYVMLAAGGMTAAIDFICQTIAVLRRQRAVMKLYLITFAFSLFVPILLVSFTGLPGAVIGYLIVMCILFTLLIWEYGKIRLQLSREDREKAEEEINRRRRERAAR